MRAALLLGVLPLAMLAACERSQPEAVVDWRQRAATLAVPGWTIAFCEGDAPMLCIERDGRHAGVVEAITGPLDAYTGLQRALIEGATLEEALAQAGEQLAQIVREDRRALDGEYDVVSEPPVPVRVAGWEGVRTGLRVTRQGDTIERYVQYRAAVAETFVLLTAAGAVGVDRTRAPTAEFALRDLEDFGPVLDLIAAASRF
jgi:hypothetical protein